MFKLIPSYVEPNNSLGAVQYKQSYGVLGIQVSKIRAGTRQCLLYLSKDEFHISLIFSKILTGELTESSSSSVRLKGKLDGSE